MFRIITDSASDISQEEAKQLGIQVLPIKTIFGDEEYLDGVTIQHEEYWNRMIETGEIPSTSQIAPFEYEECFEEVAKAGEEALVITISAKLSGCYQSAHIGAEDYADRIYIVDSQNVTVGERSLVEYAIRLREEGRSAAETAEELDRVKGRIHLIALLDTLEYLKKGGRISAAAAIAGAVLSIKPVIAIEGGQVAVLGKARGSKQGNNMLREQIDKNGPIDFTMPHCLAYTGLSDVLLTKYLSDHEDLYKPYEEEMPVSTVGSAIGTHIGPGAICFAFFKKE